MLLFRQEFISTILLCFEDGLPNREEEEFISNLELSQLTFYPTKQPSYTHQESWHFKELKSDDL